MPPNILSLSHIYTACKNGVSKIFTKTMKLFRKLNKQLLTIDLFGIWLNQQTYIVHGVRIWRHFQWNNTTCAGTHDVQGVCFVLLWQQTSLNPPKSLLASNCSEHLIGYYLNLKYLGWMRLAQSFPKIHQMLIYNNLYEKKELKRWNWNWKQPILCDVACDKNLNQMNPFFLFKSFATVALF